MQKVNITDLEEAKKYINIWWKNNIEPLIMDGNLNQATHLDYEHLVAMGCARISIGASINQVLSRGLIEPENQFTDDKFKDQAWDDTLKIQWESLGHITLTSVGLLTHGV